MDMHKRLIEARKKAGFSKRAPAAEALGVPYPTYSGHEGGSREYDWETAKKYGRKFKVSPEWLMDGTGEMEPASSGEDGLQEGSYDAECPEIVAERITKLIELLNDRQKAAFLTVLESFTQALGISENKVPEGQQHIPQDKFLGVEDGSLDHILLEKASKEIRRQEKELTAYAIFNSEEHGRRLKFEYNKLYLKKSEEDNKG